MCARLADVRKAFAAYARTLEPACLSPTQAETVLAEVTAIGHIAGTVKALVAARVAEGATWKRAGARSPAEHIAKATGTSVGAALDDLNLAEKLAALPALR